MPRNISYNVITDVRKPIPYDPDGEFLCLQYVFPTEDGVANLEAASYRFIRFSVKENRLKPQKGQAQVPDLQLMVELILEMAIKRGITHVINIFSKS